MEAIETLMNEHRLIERVCDALEGYATAAARRPVEDREELAKFVTFIGGYADGHHHGKEEDILFAAMVQAGFSREFGPVAVMLAEHDRGRACVANLRRLSEQPQPWSDEDRGVLLESALGYASLLHGHIQKEDAILYPMAEQRLPAETLEGVDSACAAHDADAGNASTQERLHALGEELVKRYAPHAPAPRSMGCCG